MLSFQPLSLVNYSMFLVYFYIKSVQLKLNIQDMFTGPKHHTHSTVIFFCSICSVITMSWALDFYVDLFKKRKYFQISAAPKSTTVSVTHGHQPISQKIQSKLLSDCRMTRACARLHIMARVTAGCTTHRGLILLLSKSQVGSFLLFYLFETGRENNSFCAFKYSNADLSLNFYGGGG